MTAEDIEAREYVYCSAQYSGATAQWGEPRLINLYPRNYVVKARQLFAQGRVAP